MNIVADTRVKVVLWEMIVNNVPSLNSTGISQGLSGITIRDREKGETIISNLKKELY